MKGYFFPLVGRGWALGGYVGMPPWVSELSLWPILVLNFVMKKGFDVC